MSNLMGGGSTPAYTPTKYSQLQLQTSTRGLPIAVGWGKNRWSVNVIWYNDFQAYPVDGKGGKGGGKGSTNYSYTCAIILALGEGPINTIDQVWADGQLSTLGSLNLSWMGGSASQEVWNWLEDNYPSQALPYAYTAYLYSELYQLGESASVPNHNFEVSAHLTGTMPGTPDANLGDIIPDMITNSQYGIDPGADYLDVGSIAFFKTYQQAQGIFMSPYLNRQEKGLSILQRWMQLGNSWGFFNGLQFKIVPLGDAPLTANGVTYTPYLTPVFDFTEDDFVMDGENSLQVEIVDPWEGYNWVEIDISDRSQYYNNNPVYWSDQASYNKFGYLQSQIISAPEICENNVAYIVASLIGQRSVYIRRKPKWKCNLGVAQLLEPGDIVTLTMASMGLNKFPVRITDVKENENFSVDIQSEEFPGSVGQTVLYPPGDNVGTGTPDMYEDPGPVNTPLIFEPSLDMTGGVPQIWVGSSGGSAWGGAYVYASPDGTNYAPIGQLSRPTPQGTLTAGLPSHADPDLTDTLALDTTESGAAISTAVTEQMADDYQTLSYIDTELLSYGTVTLTGTDLYSLTYLRRGAYSTGIAAHAEGAQWYGINPSNLLKYTYPPNYVGNTIYLKFCSYNIFGNSVESIADVTAYPYTILGTAYTIDPPTSCSLVLVNLDDTGTLDMCASWGASPSPNVGSYNVEFSTNGGANWPYTQNVPASALSTYLGNLLASTNYIARVQAVASNSSAVSSWVTSTVVNSGGTPLLPPAEPVGLTNAEVLGQVVLNWTENTDTSVTLQAIARATNSTSFSAASIYGTAALGTHTFTDAAVVAGNYYSYFLAYVNAAGTSPYAETTTGTITALEYITAGGENVTSNSDTLTL